MSKPQYQHREGDEPGKAWNILPSYMKNKGHCPSPWLAGNLKEGPT